ncbi:MAG: FAD-binding protein, partial [Rhodothermaceae bacterium]|nr:FAD-binding protein [Rhodothermaceae bacterium]
MEYIDIHSRKAWQNQFKNFRAPINKHCRIRNELEPYSAIQTLQRATAGLQSLIGRAEKALTTLRAAGAGWSISPIAVTPGFLLETHEMNFIASVPAHHVSPVYSKNCDSLLITQGGALIADINAFLEQHGRSLSTSAANNGQTIAGAISTGTHGSALENGGIQDH